MKNLIIMPFSRAIRATSKFFYAIQHIYHKFKKAFEVIAVSVVFMTVMYVMALGIGRAIDIEFPDHGENETLVSQDK